MSIRLPGALVALALMSAGPAPRVIPLGPGDDEAIVIPAASPVHFTGFNKENMARFSGRFVLNGTLVYGCDIECGPPVTEDQLFAAIEPDKSLAAVLPHWKLRGGPTRIYLDSGDRLARLVVTRREKAALLAGKFPAVRKQVSIVVDDFRADIECDAASYTVRFVALAKPAMAARTKARDNSGCG